MQESYLISVALKATIVLAGGFLGLRSRSAATRHLVFLASLACAAAVPVIALWAPQWSYVIAVAGAPGGAPATIPAGVWNWPAMASAVWGFGIVVMLLRAAGGWALLLRARHGSVHFRDAEKAEVRIAHVNTPLTCGVLRP